jgi:hypothetical protein
MRISQNSSAFCGAHRACGQDREWQESSRIGSTDAAPSAQMLKVRAAPGEEEDTIQASCHDNDI